MSIDTFSFPVIYRSWGEVCLQYFETVLDLVFEHNEQEIIQYRERITGYKALIDDYLQKRELVEAFVSAIGETSKSVNEIYGQVVAAETELDNILEKRAHKEIFLQVYESKGVIERFFRRRYAKRVSAELERGAEGLFQLRTNYINLGLSVTTQFSSTPDQWWTGVICLILLVFVKYCDISQRYIPKS